MGIHDRVLSEQLQLDAELTLEKAKKRARQREAIQEQQVTLKGEGAKPLSKLPIDSVGSRKGKQTHKKSSNRRIIQNATVVAKSHMQETRAQLKKQYVTIAKGEAITAPNVSRENLFLTLTLVHPMSSPKSTMTHCSWTPLIVGRRMRGMSQFK